MQHGSLFSGIGGFDLAAQWMGWENIFHCEIEPFPRKILNYYWPNAITYEDIKTTDFSIHRGKIDVLTGGFPCQPFSMAGKRKGTEDPRNLWPEYLRAIKQIKPRYVVGENVYGLINWSAGLVFEQVQIDLEVEGYQVAPVILPACSIGAPHRRDRIWFVAYCSAGIKREEIRRRNEEKTFNGNTRYGSNGTTPDPDKHTTRPPGEGTGINRKRSRNIIEPQERRQQAKQYNRCSNVLSYATNPGCSFRQNGLYGKKQEWETTKFGNSYTKFGQFNNFPTTQPTICGRNDGISNRLDGITFPKWRNESIKAYGNAIVPQVAHQIFKAIKQFENFLNP